MVLSALLLAVVALAASSALVMGHVVLEHPAPRLNVDDRLKEFPCGSGGQYNDVRTTASMRWFPVFSLFTIDSL